MKIRTVESIFNPQIPHFVGDGFRVHNYIPSVPQLSMQRMNPFIMLDYNSKFHFPPSPKPKGVGVHPHRGFETVTIAYNGKIAHHDSAGGGGIIDKGDVQWMTAASGILHKEYHEEEWSKKGGDFQMVQLWVNLPSKDKMSPPKYQAIKNESLKRFQLADNGGEIEVIAGTYRDIAGAAFTFTPINMLNVKFNKKGKAQFDFPSTYNTALLVIEGSININNNQTAPANHFVLMANDGESFVIEATEDAIVLVLSGEPIPDPIAAHGPFVMNTREEILQAFEDFESGKFGNLAD